MSKNYRYYGGVSVLKKALTPFKSYSFKDFFVEALKFPIMIGGITKEKYHTLPRKAQNAHKDVEYISPGCYNGENASRSDEAIVHCNLLCFDIDDSDDARTFVTHPDLLSLQLDPFNFVAYKSASHTDEKPRIRIVVEANGIDKRKYAQSVASIAKKLGVKVNRESRTAALPMYRPSSFKGETTNPVFLAAFDGRAFTKEDIEDIEIDIRLTKEANANEHSTALDDLDHVRAKVPSFTMDHAEEALKFISPDLPREEWISIGMAICHQFGEDGWELFDDWSSKSSKYDVEQPTRKVWESCSQSPRSKDPITARSILKRATDGGWSPDAVIAMEVNAAEKELFLLDGTRSQMVVKGLKLIAKIPMLNVTDEDALLEALNNATMKHFKKRAPMPTLRKHLKDLRREERFGGKRQDKLFEWSNDFCYASSQDIFIKQMTMEKYSAEALDRTYGSLFLPKVSLKDKGKLSDLSPEVQPQRYLLFNCDIQKVYDFRYDPSTKDKFIEDGDVQYLNTYIADFPELELRKARKCGRILERHIANLIAEPEYQNILLDWMAFHVQNPGVKIRWAPLIQGAQGCGKTFIAEALQAVLGTLNVKMVEASAVSQQWNEWAANCQLVAVEEIRLTSKNRYEVLNKLKPLVTNDHISLSRRFTDQVTVPNLTNYMFFTNFHDSIPIDENDRRHFVIKSRLQTAKQVAELEEGGYFNELFGMIEEYPGGLRSYLMDREIDESFKPNGRAPRTKYHKVLVETTSSDGKIAFKEFVNADPRVMDDMISANHLLIMYETEALDMTPRKLTLLLSSLGYEKSVTVTKDREKHVVWIEAGSEWTEAKPKVVKEEFWRRCEGSTLLG